MQDNSEGLCLSWTAGSLSLSIGGLCLEVALVAHGDTEDVGVYVHVRQERNDRFFAGAALNSTKTKSKMTHCECNTAAILSPQA